MATEIAIFQLKDGKHPEDANSVGGQVLKDTLNTLTEQKGFQRAYWGSETENPNTLRLFVDWDSVQDHVNFTKAEHYQPFMDQFSQIADIDTAQLFHVQFTPHPPSEALSDHVSPSTEIGVVYFAKDFSQKDEFLEEFKKMIGNIEQQAADVHTASAGGWTEEEISIPGTSEKGIAYVGAIGWKSMEAHMTFRSTSTHEENLKMLEKFKDQIKHTSVVHSSLTQVNKGGGGVGDISGGAATSIQGEILNPQGAGQSAPKTAADGSTTKNNDDLKGAANSAKKERAGR